MWYNKKTNQPRIVIGPDFCFSFVELMLANIITWGLTLVPSILTKDLVIFIIGLTLLSLQNISFIGTVMANPGLPPRDPAFHKKSYTHKVKQS